MRTSLFRWFQHNQRKASAFTDGTKKVPSLLSSNQVPFSTGRPIPNRQQLHSTVQGPCPSCGRWPEKDRCCLSLGAHLLAWVRSLDLQRKQSASPIPASHGKSF